MVILVDLLSTTDPSLLPTSSSTPATSWDSRHPPLLIQDKIHKGLNSNHNSITSLPKKVHFLLPSAAYNHDYASRAAYFHAHEGGELDEDELWFVSGVRLRALQNSSSSRHANGDVRHSILKNSFSQQLASSLPNGHIPHSSSSTSNSVPNKVKTEPMIETIYEDDFFLPVPSLYTIQEEEDDAIYYSDTFSQTSFMTGLSNPVNSDECSQTSFMTGLSNPAYSSLHSSTSFLTGTMKLTSNSTNSDVSQTCFMTEMSNPAYNSSHSSINTIISLQNQANSDVFSQTSFKTGLSTQTNSDVLSQTSFMTGLSNPAYSSLHSSTTFLTAEVHSDISSYQDAQRSPSTRSVRNNDEIDSVRSGATTYIDAQEAFDSLDQVSSENSLDSYATVPNISVIQVPSLNADSQKISTDIDSPEAFEKLDHMSSTNSFESFVTVPTISNLNMSSFNTNTKQNNQRKTLHKSASLSKISTIYSPTTSVPSCFRSFEHLSGSSASNLRTRELNQAKLSQKQNEIERSSRHSVYAYRPTSNKNASKTPKSVIKDLPKNLTVNVYSKVQLHDQETLYISSSTFV